MCSLEGSVADDSGAQQRRSGRVVEFIRQGVSERLGNHGIFRVTTVVMVAGVTRCRAQVLSCGATEPTGAVRAPQPRDTYALSFHEMLALLTEPIDHSYHLVAGNHRPLHLRQVSLDNVQIRSAYAARPHSDAYFPRAGCGKVSFTQL